MNVLDSVTRALRSGGYRVDSARASVTGSVTLSVVGWPRGVLMVTCEPDGAVTVTETPYKRTLLGRRYGKSTTTTGDVIDLEFWILSAKA